MCTRQLPRSRTLTTPGPLEVELFLSKHFALFCGQSKYSNLKFMFCMYFLMIILNMAKFRRQRELGKQMCGRVVPALVESRAKDKSGEN